MKKYLYLLLLLLFALNQLAFAQPPSVSRIVPNQVNLGHLVKIYGKNLGQISAIRFGSTAVYPVVNLNDSTLLVVVRGSGSTWSLESGNITVATTNQFTFSSNLPTAPVGSPTFCNGTGGITRVRILGTNFDTGILPYCISGSPKFFNNLTDTLKSDTIYQVEIFHSSFQGINLKVDYNRDGDFADYGESTGTTVQNPNGSVILSMVIPQHTASSGIPMEVSNSAGILPGNGNDQTSYWNFRLEITGSVGGPSYCYTSLFRSCPPADLQLDSVIVPELEFRKKVSPCTNGYTLVKKTGLSFVQGRVYSFGLRQNGTSQAIATAWLDMNFNSNLADQNPIFQSSNPGGPIQYATFSVPVNTDPNPNPPATGTTRLRIRLDAGNTAMVPCSTSASNAQTIDYLVNIEKSTPNRCIPSGTANGCNGTNGLSALAIPGTEVNTPLACPADNSTYQLLPLNTRTEDSLETGRVYKIRVQSQFAGSVAAWADWNGDGRLLTNEWLGSGESPAAGSWIEIPFTVPANAKNDRLLFRLRTKTGSSFETLEACSTTNGNTYDFTMVIRKGNSSDPVAYCTEVQTNNCTALLNSLRIKGTGFNLVNPSCTGLAYRNFAATGSATASLSPGQNYILSWSGVSNLKVALWADWNLNGLFEETEFVGGSGNSFYLRRAANFSGVPQVRIRIRASATEGFNSGDACAQRGSGLTFDFTLSTPQTLCAAALRKEISCDTAAFWIDNISNGDMVYGLDCSDFQNAYTELNQDFFGYLGYSNFLRMDSGGSMADFGVEFLVNSHPTVTNKRVAVWADWNGNEIFEANEFTSLGSNTDWKNIQVRAGAVGNVVRVRYRVKDGTSAFTSGQSCTPFARSLTLDFFLNVGKPVNTCPVLINRRNCTGTPSNYIEQISINQKPIFDFADICINPPLANEGYHAFYNYGATRANLQAGSAAALEVKLHTPVGNSIVFGWIDWNQDGTYAPSEYFVLTGTSNRLYNGTLSVPGSAGAGVYNGRIRHYPLPAFVDWPNSACTQLLPYNSSDADFSIRIFEDCPPKPSILTPQGTVICTGGAVQLSVNANGNQVRWSNGQTTPNISVFTPGIYRVALLNTVCLSDSSDPVLLTTGTTPAQPVIQAPVTTVCQGDSALLTGPSGFSTYQWSNGGPNRSFIWVKTTSSITLRVSNGCVSPASAPVNVTVSSPPPPATITPGGNISLCTGDSVLLSAPQGFQYLWSTGQTTRTIWAKNLAVDYQVQLIVGACTSAVSPVVNLQFFPRPSKPEVVISGNLSFCAGDSVKLTAPEGFSYQWSNGASTREIWVKQSGTYTVRTFFTSQCLSLPSNPLTITVAPAPPKPIISPQGNIGICLGDSVRLSAISGGILPTIWSTGATTPTIWVKTAGIYTARTILGACTSQVSEPKDVSVSPKPPRPVITVEGPSTFCLGDSVRLSAVFTGNGVQWSNGSAQPAIWVKRSGVYYVNAFVNAACQPDTSLPVSISTLPKPRPVQISSPASTSICQGDSILLSAPAGFTSYRWSGGQTSSSIFAKTAGRYSVQVAGANGCFSDTLGYFDSGLYFFPAGATDGDSIHIFLNPALTCPLPASNPTVSMQGTSIARLHSGVTLNGTDWQNVVSTTNAALEPQTRFRNLSGGWFLKSIFPKTYYNLGNQAASQLCLVTNGGNPAGGWFEKEGKRVSAANCSDFFIPLPIPRSAFANPFAVTVSLKPSPTVTIAQNGGQFVASPAAGLQFQWLLNGAVIAGATGSAYTPLQAGNYQVVATNNQNCRDSSNVLFFTSVPETKAGKNRLQIYPNPVASHLVIEGEANHSERLLIQWFDVQGKSLFAEEIQLQNGQAILDISGRLLPKAIYQLRIQSPTGTEWHKVVKE